MKTNILNLKEYECPKETFIGGWYIPENICDGVIQCFYDNQDKVVKGRIGNSEEEAGSAVNNSEKDSYDLAVTPNSGNVYMNAYENYLTGCFKNYIEKYHHINDNYWFDLNIRYNIQHYKKSGGFKKWHFERSSPGTSSHRVLVFMTYLNDVEDGGTEFYYQGIKTKAEKGLTLLWPTDFTHTHKGIISHTKEKYIVTGWYTYNEI